MTDNEALAAGVALLPELRSCLAGMSKEPLGPQAATVGGARIETLIAALEAAERITIADGCGCKMAWAQGFCYGDPEYYPSAPAPQGMDVMEMVAEGSVTVRGKRASYTGHLGRVLIAN